MIAREDTVERFIQEPSRRNRDDVIAAHLHLCKRAARKFRRPGNDGADLEQVAAVGLIKATDGYRPERTTPFEAYAWIVIIGELMHYVRDHERAIRIPRRLRELDRRYARAWECLAARRQAEPTVNELAGELNVDVHVIDELRAFRGQAARDADRSGGTRLEQVASAFPGPSIEERVTLLMALDALSARERTIVLGTFGAGLSQAEVAAQLHLSQGQISKLLNRALAKLAREIA